MLSPFYEYYSHLMRHWGNVNTDDKGFIDMRYTNCVSIWPVGLAGGLMYETPLVKHGKVTGFRTFFKRRTFETDMAGFAVSVRLLKDKPSAIFRMSARYIEDDLLKQLDISLNDLEPKADDCSKVLVWHTKTLKTNVAYEEHMSNRHTHAFNQSNKINEV